MKKILIIREFDNFSEVLLRQNFKIINLPLIQIAPLADLSDFKSKLENLEKYDGIFITSKHSAEILLTQNVQFKGTIYVLGKSSLEILKKQNLKIFFNETANTARELLEKIPVENLSNKRFLFIRGEKSLQTIPEFLSEISQVDQTIVYQTEQIPVGIDKIKSVSKNLENGEITATCFFSPSGAKSFISQFDKGLLQKTKIAVIGKTTADFFAKRKLEIAFTASKSTAESFAKELVDYLKEN